MHRRTILPALILAMTLLNSSRVFCATAFKVISSDDYRHLVRLLPVPEPATVPTGTRADIEARLKQDNASDDRAQLAVLLSKDETTIQEAHRSIRDAVSTLPHKPKFYLDYSSIRLRQARSLWLSPPSGLSDYDWIAAITARIEDSHEHSQKALLLADSKSSQSIERAYQQIAYGFLLRSALRENSMHDAATAMRILSTLRHQTPANQASAGVEHRLANQLHGAAMAGMLRKGGLPAAVGYFQTAAGATGSDYIDWHLYGVILRAEGRGRDAIRALRKAAEYSLTDVVKSDINELLVLHAAIDR
ncbi:MAG: hypothetical protein ACYTGL_14705 [Planctomycetota bacterium]|jgi:hypothetical protein